MSHIKEMNTIVNTSPNIESVKNSTSTPIDIYKAFDVGEQTEDLDLDIEIPMKDRIKNEGLTIDIAFELLTKNLILKAREDIKSINSNEDNTKLEIQTKDGTVYNYKLKDNDYVLTTLKMSNGTVTHFDEDFAEINQILSWEIAAIKMDSEIKAHTKIKINGKTINIYATSGKGSIINNYEEALDGILAAFSSYPKGILDQLLSSGFDTIIVGPQSETYGPDSNWSALTYGDDYMFLENTTKNVREVLIHELAHVLDSSIVNGNGHYTDKSKEVKRLYKKYGKMIQQIKIGGYSSDEFPEGPPNVNEFFAKAITQYIECPEELEMLVPELYEYIEEMFTEF